MRVDFTFLFSHSLNESYGHVLANAALQYTKEKGIPQTAGNLDKLITRKPKAFHCIANRMIADWEAGLSKEELAMVNQPCLGADDPEVWQRNQIPMTLAIFAHFLQNSTC